MTVIKKSTDQLTEELMRSMVSKVVHVPTNYHLVKDQIGGGEVLDNIWFAGTVAGFAIQEIHYDVATDTFLVEPNRVYLLLLTDGSGYALADSCEVNELTDDEFRALVMEQAQKEGAPEIVKPKLEIVRN